LHAAGGPRQETLPYAWRCTGSGAPKGNKNALKHGRYTRQAIAERRRVSDLIRQARELLGKID
jgi:hypothetical protein